MLNKLKLHFINSADMEPPEKDELVRMYFENKRRDKLKEFASGFNLSSHEAGLLGYAKQYLETPEILHPLFELSAHKELATLAQIKISRLNRAIDEAEFELTTEGIEPKAKIVLPQLIKRLREEFEIWREVIRNGDFDVYQTRPYETIPEYFEKYPNLKDVNLPELNRPFPFFEFKVPWNPEAAKMKKEPEEFRQIWLNPDEDIPFVLEALKELEFIDENEVWRWNKIADYPGAVIDAILINTSRLITPNYRKLNKIFGRRFKFPDPEKRFERGKGTYKESRKKMDNYLKNNN
jgi:hypothetical protein